MVPIKNLGPSIRGVLRMLSASSNYLGLVFRKKCLQNRSNPCSEQSWKICYRRSILFFHKDFSNSNKIKVLFLPNTIKFCTSIHGFVGVFTSKN